MTFSSRLNPYTESIPEGWRVKEEESRYWESVATSDFQDGEIKRKNQNQKDQIYNSRIKEH